MSVSEDELITSSEEEEPLKSLAQQSVEGWDVEVVGHILKPKFDSGVSEAVGEKLYPHFHQWLSHKQQDILTWLISGSIIVWAILYVLNGQHIISIPASIMGVLMCVPPALSLVLLHGLVSTRPEFGVWLGPLIMLAIIGYGVYSPRLLFPIFTGIFGTGLVLWALNVIAPHGLVQWHNKLTLYNYMFAIPSFLALMNCFFFKFWCQGQMPLLVYILLFPLLQWIGTKKENNKPENYDYVVTQVVWKRLAAFRFGILTSCFVIPYLMQNLMMNSGVISKDAWECKPLAF